MTEVHRDRTEPSPARNVSTASSGSAETRPVMLKLPQARHWIIAAILLGAAVLVLGLTVQFLPGESVVELGVDQDLSRHHAAVLTAAAMVLNVAFGPLFGVGAIALIAVTVLLVRKSVADAIGFGVVAASGWAASEFFKLIIRRDRPNPGMLFDPLAPETGSNSFPSGHVSFAITLGFALYCLARETRWARPAAAAGVVLAPVVAWSRLYIGVHYPTDVAASFLAAGAALVLLTGLWNRFAARILQRLPVNAATRQFLS
ncbi:phosphatase PAP2 family protein [Arthrobacter sp. NPDC058288]|uniref:phosphatase PAP2 family protein n=1 Tax=Arthrobacter sp. NPDC058288 TaxID=3346424 RepID=UPI0036E8F461